MRLEAWPVSVPYTTLLLAVAAISGVIVVVLPPPALVVVIGAWTFGMVAVFGGLSRALVGLASLAAMLGVLLVTMNGLRITEWASFADLLLLAAGVGLIPASLLRGQPIPLWLLAAGAVIFVSGIPTAVGDERHLIPLLRFALVLVFVPVLVAVTREPRRIADLFVASAAVGGGIALFDAVTGAGFGRSITGAHDFVRWAGLSLHSNHLATACAMALPIASYRMLSARLLTRLLAGGAVAFIIGGLMVSGSRGGVLAGLIGVIAMLVLCRRNIGKRSLGALTVAVGVGFAALGLTDNPTLSSVAISMDRLTGVEATTVSDRIRLDLYRNAIEEFERSPIWGMGYGHVREAHNIYLQLLQAGGALGLAGFGAFVIGSLRLRSSRVGLSGATAAAMIAWLAVGLVNTPIDDRYLYIPAGILLGLAKEMRHGHWDYLEGSASYSADSEPKRRVVERGARGMEPALIATNVPPD